MRALALVLIATSCSCTALPDRPDGDGVDAPGLGLHPRLSQSIEYVGKTSTTDFTGLGQHLQYWPMFGRSSGASGGRTDCDRCIERTGGVSGNDFHHFQHHIVFPVDQRTFSPDAGGDPIGVKTAGGYAGWASFTLPDGTQGRSGTFYDTAAIDSSNNSVNQIILDSGAPSEFCLNLITDNTNGAYDPDVRLEARSDDVDLDLRGHPDLTFDGSTDMYTFLYRGMQDGDRIKIKLSCSSSSGCQGAGLGGIMVSDVSTCTATSSADAGVEQPDAGGGGGTSGDGGLGAGDAGGGGGGRGSGGCSAASSGGPSGVWMVLFLWLAARRRTARAGSGFAPGAGQPGSTR